MKSVKISEYIYPKELLFTDPEIQSEFRKTTKSFIYSYSNLIPPD